MYLLDDRLEVRQLVKVVEVWDAFPANDAVYFFLRAFLDGGEVDHGEDKGLQEGGRGLRSAVHEDFA